MNKISTVSILGQIGKCGQLEVFLGFAPANILYKCSFADILNDETGSGYQRPFNLAHSKNFKNYIEKPASSTIPLTFNLRPDLSEYWILKKLDGNNFELQMDSYQPCFAQVDCQHRLGDMLDSDISFAFMTYIGLDIRSEMALFNIINSRAKGLSSSLTDYHQTRLLDDLEQTAPHLLIAKRLNEDSNSPWYKMVRYGGESNSGLMRRTSFRMLQTSIKKHIKKMFEKNIKSIDMQYDIIKEYWRAVKVVFNDEWNDHRHYLLTKGVGLYSLMELLGDFIVQEEASTLCEEWFINILKSLKPGVDWSSNGTFATAGGKKGANEVYLFLKRVLNNASITCRTCIS